MVEGFIKFIVRIWFSFYHNNLNKISIFDYIMKLVHIRVLITALAVNLAVVFILLVDIYPHKSALIFNIEVIMLPAIYIIGNYAAEYVMGRNYHESLSKYQEDIDTLTSITEKLDRKVFNQEILINKYKKNIKS